MPSTPKKQNDAGEAQDPGPGPGPAPGKLPAGFEPLEGHVGNFSNDLYDPEPHPLAEEPPEEPSTTTRVRTNSNYPTNITQFTGRGFSASAPTEPPPRKSKPKSKPGGK